MMVLMLALAIVLGLWAGVLLAFAGPLAARWREPVLRHPVLIIESDDWGAGPLRQAEALSNLSALLQGVRDRNGHPAVMTLGVVLEVPDGERIAAAGCTEYHALPLADARFDGVRDAIQRGMAAGVFAPQLHGQCHFWPPALLAAAQGDAALRDWLTAPEPAATEDLPAHLQSRWVDAPSLPSRALDPAVIRQAALAEGEGYQALFGPPQVAVATTFVWNDVVEAAWAQAGVEVIVTPGHRATCRAPTGEPGCVDRAMLTGEHSLAAGQVYLVRDVYFEPALGHGPQRLVDGLRARTRQGRACLVETHRFNFLRAPGASLDALETALREALVACPELRFVSPFELAQAIRTRDPVWIETSFRPRLAAWRARLDEIPRFHRAARWTGFGLPLALLEARA